MGKITIKLIAGTTTAVIESDVPSGKYFDELRHEMTWDPHEKNYMPVRCSTLVYLTKDLTKRAKHGCPLSVVLLAAIDSIRAEVTKVKKYPKARIVFTE